MIPSLLLGFAVGFVLAIPPGPVGVATLKAGLRGNERGGLFISLGTGAMDVLYCMFVMLATSAVFSSIELFFSEYPLAMFSFQAACILGMVGYGIVQIRFTSHKPYSEHTPGTFQRISERLKKNGPFFIGVAIALTNIANPTFLPSIAYTSMFVQHAAFFENTLGNCALFSLGFGLGNIGWLYLLLRVVLYYKDRFSPEFTLRLHRFAGLTMIGAGTLLGYRVALNKGPEILRLLFAF